SMRSLSRFESVDGYPNLRADGRHQLDCFRVEHELSHRRGYPRLDANVKLSPLRFVPIPPRCWSESMQHSSEPANGRGSVSAVRPLDREHVPTLDDAFVQLHEGARKPLSEGIQRGLG